MRQTKKATRISKRVSGLAQACVCSLDTSTSIRHPRQSHSFHGCCSLRQLGRWGAKGRLAPLSAEPWSEDTSPARFPATSTQNTDSNCQQATGRGFKKHGRNFWCQGYLGGRGTWLANIRFREEKASRCRARLIANTSKSCCEIDKN